MMEQISRDPKNNKIVVKLVTFSFKEEESHIRYSPSLNLSGYGLTKEEANESFEYILKDFIKSSLEKKSLASSLAELGWSFEKDEHPGQLDYNIYCKDETFLKPLSAPSQVIEFEAELICD